MEKKHRASPLVNRRYHQLKRSNSLRSTLGFDDAADDDEDGAGCDAVENPPPKRSNPEAAPEAADAVGCGAELVPRPAKRPSMEEGVGAAPKDRLGPPLPPPNMLAPPCDSGTPPLPPKTEGCIDDVEAPMVETACGAGRDSDGAGALEGNTEPPAL